MKKKKVCNLYYCILLAFIVGQAALTVFGLSRTVYYQQQLSHLQKKYEQISAQKSQINTKLSQELSLSHNTLAVADEYKPIKDTLILSSTQQVALR